MPDAGVAGGGRGSETEATPLPHVVCDSRALGLPSLGIDLREGIALHPNEQVVRQFLSALLSTRDFHTAGGLLADDVRIHFPGRNRLSGEYTGRSRYFDLFDEILKLTQGTFRPELHDVTASEHHTVALLHHHAERSGRIFDYEQVVVYHVEDGKIIEIRPFVSDQFVWDELLA